MKQAIESGNVEVLANFLSQQPDVAKALVSFGQSNEYHVSPIHYVCDCVFEHKIDKPSALLMVKLLLDSGVDINGPAEPGQDSPLVAACSLHCDEIALLLLSRNADTSRRGTHGGTCLHWASWTGADRVVKQLLTKPLDLEDCENDFACTPLLWAINGLLTRKGSNVRNQEEVIKLLVRAGANIHAKDQEGNSAVSVLEKQSRLDLLNLIRFS